MKVRPGQSSLAAAGDGGTVIDADDGILDLSTPVTEEDTREQNDRGGRGQERPHPERKREQSASARSPDDAKDDVMNLRLGSLPAEGVQPPEMDNVIACGLADIDHAVRSVALSALTGVLLIVATECAADSNHRFATGIAIYLAAFLVTVILARRLGREDGDLPPGTVGDARFVLALAGAAVIIKTPPSMDGIGIAFLYAAAGLCGAADGTRIAIVGLRRNLTFRQSLREIRRHYAPARRQAWARLTRPHNPCDPGERP